MGELVGGDDVVRILNKYVSYMMRVGRLFDACDPFNYIQFNYIVT